MKSKLFMRNKKREIRRRRIRSKIKGSIQRPRVCIYKSLKHIYIQFIDDKKGHTLLGVSDGHLPKTKKSLPKLKRAELLAKLAAQKAKKLKIKSVVFDRSGYPYKGIVKIIAEGLRKEGLKL